MRYLRGAAAKGKGDVLMLLREDGFGHGEAVRVDVHVDMKVDMDESVG